MSNLPVHSKLGASQMHRWAECPGSVRLSVGIEGTTSEYAAEGTVAHEVAAEWLEGTLPTLGEKRIVDGHEIEVTQEMLDAVGMYVHALDEDAEALAPITVLVEHKFHLKDVHTDLYGTSDAVMLHPKQRLLRVYDYKHGAGVPVEVKDNPQLLYYALGALIETKAAVDEVEIVVVQPRCYHPDGPVRRQRIKTVDLLDFSADLLAAVHRTEDPNAPLVPGEHCRWCKAAAICPALKDKATTLAKLEFTPVVNYDAQELSKTLEWLPIIEAWVESTRKFAYGEAQHGRCPPGFKLVEKVGRRAWVDEHTAEIELQKLGMAESDLYGERKLQSPAQIEKKLKKEWKSVIDLLAETKSSGSTLVPDSDKRQALKTDAASDFAAITDITEVTDGKS